MKKSVVFMLLAVSSMISLLVPGCGTPLGFKGESCERRADCADGLACVNKVCAAGSISVASTAKECVIVECSADLDCCPVPDQNLCNFLQDQCTGFGDQSACDQYTQMCGPAHCDAWTCDQKSSQCKFTKPCQTNDECGEGNICLDWKCQVMCNFDSDCAAFERCQSNVCVEGKCATDRECKAATRNALATCEKGECIEPCQTDVECADAEDWNFHACVNGQCAYVGCASDKECQYYFDQNGLPAADNKDIKCRATR